MRWPWVEGLRAKIPNLQRASLCEEGGKPFYYLGLLQGAAGGVIALAIVASLLALLNREVGALAASYGSSFRLSFLSAPDAAATLVLAGALGWLGAQLSVSRHLRAIEPR